MLFDSSATHHELAARLERGARVQSAEVDSEGHRDLDVEAILLFILKAYEGLRILTADDGPEPKPGDELIALLGF